MANELGPLEEASLSPAVREAVGAAVPEPQRMMAARGMVHLSPVDQVVALYQLTHDASAEVREAAQAAAKALPDEVLVVALPAVREDLVLESWARDEERLLRCPAIITALYLNPRTRMSTARRVVELAVRNKVEVSGIPCIEDIKAAIEADCG